MEDTERTHDIRMENHTDRQGDPYISSKHHGVGGWGWGVRVIIIRLY